MSDVEKYIQNQKNRGMWFPAPQWACQCEVMARHQKVIAEMQYRNHILELQR